MWYKSHYEDYIYNITSKTMHISFLFGEIEAVYMWEISHKCIKIIKDSRFYKGSVFLNPRFRISISKQLLYHKHKISKDSNKIIQIENEKPRLKRG